MTDHLVEQAEEAFQPVWVQTKGNDGWVSFELDPLLEDVSSPMPVAERTAHYIELGKKVGSRSHQPHDQNTGHSRRDRVSVRRTITPQEVSAQRRSDLCVNSVRHGAVMRCGCGAQQRRKSLEWFKSVYSIFVSRLDVYTSSRVPTLSAAAQGQVGIVNAKRIWRMNETFWSDKKLPLKQENDSSGQHGHQK
jgi:transaldolase